MYTQPWNRGCNGGQENLGLCEKACYIQHSAPNDNFFICTGFIPSSPHSLQQCCGQKKHSFPPIVLKINFVWGGRGGVTSFTNITGNVPTLLTPILPTRGWQPLLSISHTATLTHNNLLLNGFYSQARSSVPLKISLTRPLVIQLKYCPVLPSLYKVDYYYYYNELIIWKVNPLVIAWTSIKFKSAFLHVEWAVNLSW